MPADRFGEITVNSHSGKIVEFFNIKSSLKLMLKKSLKNLPSVVACVPARDDFESASIFKIFSNWFPSFLA